MIEMLDYLMFNKKILMNREKSEIKLLYYVEEICFQFSPTTFITSRPPNLETLLEGPNPC